MFHLIVTDAFGDYAKGDRIEDPAEMAKILDGEQAARVVRVAAPPSAPAPARVAAPARDKGAE